MEKYLPNKCLPKTGSGIKEIIARVGATSGKDMGKVMGVASKENLGEDLQPKAAAISRQKLKRAFGITSPTLY